ncbi:hypothetical protein PR202_ga25506 [Eleusine coracana subsp. coracana]|uniref:Uncharacterized protein n=1 Tax=Eleusine coracana subsp. coracana TaxID=191504 RepID=A0AAV5DBI6_ELECO|nr:hypothetical protein PR202_ga25445 [Eleusine coracana subsp. coracana]GJN07661.1 hypothetical protein PR202_ga25506 [Eleusine coracana subsp. coracana]
MEPYPYHYSCRPKADESAASGGAINPTMQFVLAKLQKMEMCLGDRIDGCCSSLECRIDEMEQKAKSHFITLEMAQVEFDQ